MTKSSGIIILALFVLIVAADAQKVSVLYRFGTNTGDPLRPDIIAQGRDGNLYSTAAYGGANNLGTMFKITPAGKLTVLHSFDVTHGSAPSGGLTLGTDGNFFGTTASDGSYSYGTVLKITPSGSLTVLHDFEFDEGTNPVAPPVQGRDGNLYGTAPFGGSLIPNCIDNQGPYGCGTVYEIRLSRTFTTLYKFDCAAYPLAPLIQATDGDLYGTTARGCNGGGEVFKITTAGKVTALYNFDFGAAYGYWPVAPLTQGSDGNFYGTTYYGGTGGTCSYGCGVAFKLTPNGKFTVLHSFNGTDGANPYSVGLMQATDGNFYGTTPQGGNSTNCSGGCGTIFRITPKGSYSVLYNFDKSTGAYPDNLFQHTNGILYGDTAVGGIDPNHQCGGFGCGVFYRLNVGARPFVSLLPYSGKVGNTIEFLGQGFKGTTAVCFNGKAAKFKVVSDTYLTATVPSGATTGFVTVTTSKRKLKSNKKFRVTS